MYAVSYVIIFAFHPALNIAQIIIERSSGHSTEKLTSLNHSTREQLLLKNRATLLLLRDCKKAIHLQYLKCFQQN